MACEPGQILTEAALSNNRQVSEEAIIGRLLTGKRGDPTVRYLVACCSGSMLVDERNFLLLQTDLFISQQPDDAIDAWQLGADCAGWFYARLLIVDGIEPACDAVMEDWG